jgi:hypothetical protein
MEAKRLVVDMVITSSAAFCVAAIVTYLYSLIAHGAGVVNWETAFELALVLGIVIPLAGGRDRKAK